MICDIHTHGISGYSTRGASVEDILEIARIHGEYGTEAVVLSVYPGSFEMMRSDMAAIKDAMRKQEEVGVMGARILGAHLEGPFLNPAKAGALNSDYIIPGDRRLLGDLLAGYDEIVRVITVAPEIEGGIDVIRDATERGITVMMGHSDATYEQAEAGYRAGAKGVTHLFNAMRPFHHREPGLAGFGLLSPYIYVEIISDPFHLHPSTLDMVFRLKPNERIIIVSDTVKESMADGRPVLNGDGRLMGGALPLMESLTYLESLGLKKENLYLTITQNPLRLLGVNNIQSA